MIFLDLETTGLLKPFSNDLQNQPEIIEICAIKMDSSFEEIDCLEDLLKPSIPITEIITKINGVSNEMVENKKTFPLMYDKLVDFFLGEEIVVAHNCSFDMGVLQCELTRIAKEFNFPWPPKRVCTVEKTFHIKNRRLKLQELYEMATGKSEIINAHRARSDVEALIECYKWLVNCHAI